jgi:ferritin-like metal-binding protein YciE
MIDCPPNVNRIIKMKKITDLRHFFQYEVINLFDGEMELRNYLAHITNYTFSSELKEILEKYRKINIEQVLRIEKIISENMEGYMGNMERHSDQMINTVMRELIYNAKRTFDMSDDLEVKDVIVVISIQKINNYKIACYGALCSYANVLSMKEEFINLDKTLMEEKENFKLLSILGDKNLNASARVPLSDL